MKYYFLSFVIVATSLRFAISDNVENTTSTASFVTFPTPNVKKINIALIEGLVNIHVKKLLNAFVKNKYELRVVGGAVRDVLMGVRPKDLDFATDATPGQMKYFFKQEKIYTINPNGEAHGTVTAHIHGKNYEITTLRKDDECFGRHARVIFTKNWREDATRRDLTINCMFLGFDGTLYDYCGGEEDVKNRNVRFVGDPATRIKEDFLRIMRYFRFYGRISNESDNHDPEILKAIRENKSGLSSISGERLWLEFQQILAGPLNKDVVYKMFDLGLAPFLGLGKTEDLNRTCFENICKLKENYEFKPITYLAALLPNETRVTELASRLKLSNLDRDLAIFLITQRSKPFVLIPEHPLRPYQSLLVEARNREQVKTFILELLRFLNVSDSVVQAFAGWSIPPFPMDSARLRERGISFGRQMGYVMKGLKQYWVNKNFNVTEDDLLNQIPDLVAEFRKFLSPTLSWTNPPTYTRWPTANTSEPSSHVMGMGNTTAGNDNTSSSSSSFSTWVESASTVTVQTQQIEITSKETTTQTKSITLSQDQKYKLNALDFLGGLQFTFRGF
ncbi:CCA tRNA nucleotidyltransferase 1, mitochondrial-like [Planococcus citri]|uniref:CCA tRNA nucleotidyltransferase 1, mitochondrial-like n=1 Tax=Planococcus citri TaxID=170843 RepID=UPI0031F7A491